MQKLLALFSITPVLKSSPKNHFCLALTASPYPRKFFFLSRAAILVSLGFAIQFDWLGVIVLLLFGSLVVVDFRSCVVSDSPSLLGFDQGFYTVDAKNERTELKLCGEIYMNAWCVIMPLTIGARCRRQCFVLGAWNLHAQDFHKLRQFLASA